jgi:CTP synthase
MQCATIEFARSVLGMEDANSTEFSSTTQNPVIALMAEQSKILERGGTMRLGSCPCSLVPESLARLAYGADLIHERHRHRYEFNNQYRKLFEENGFIPTGLSPDGTLVEIIELPASEHPWFLAVQFHPEFQSKPTKAHPLFRDFVSASLRRRDGARMELEAR